MLKYSINGEVIELDIDDVLEIDFTTVRGKETVQEILALKEHVKHFSDFDDADLNDSLKFYDEQKELLDDLEL